MNRFKQYKEAITSGRVMPEGTPVLVNKMGTPQFPSLFLRLEMLAFLRARKFFEKWNMFYRKNF